MTSLFEFYSHPLFGLRLFSTGSTWLHRVWLQPTRWWYFCRWLGPKGWSHAYLELAQRTGTIGCDQKGTAARAVSWRQVKFGPERKGWWNWSKTLGEFVCFLDFSDFGVDVADPLVAKSSGEVLAPDNLFSSKLGYQSAPVPRRAEWKG